MPCFIWFSSTVWNLKAKLIVWRIVYWWTSFSIIYTRSWSVKVVLSTPIATQAHSYWGLRYTVAKADCVRLTQSKLCYLHLPRYTAADKNGYHYSYNPCYGFTTSVACTDVAVSYRTIHTQTHKHTHTHTHHNHTYTLIVITYAMLLGMPAGWHRVQYWNSE